MPQGCLLKDYIPNPVAEFKTDILFIGAVEEGGIRNKRQSIIDKIKTQFDITFYPNDDITRPICFSRLHEIIPSAKIVIGESWRNDVDLCTSNIIFLTLGNGGFYLCEYFRNLGQIFKIGKHLDVFYGVNDVCEKISYYLNNPQQREKIRQSGFEYAQERHTYIDRVKNIINIIEGNEKQFNGFIQ